MSKRKQLVADLLCGAGGSSTGAARALGTLGLDMELVCVNHWGVAIETHRRNHPEARHYVQDIATVRPHLIVPEGYLDLLMADPLPTVTGANRGELAFITAQHGERPGQEPRVHDIGEPAPTIAATGHVDLVVAEAVRDGERYDIPFRMLEPHELAAAMGFTTDEATYEFAGTKTEKIKQIGNAVSVAKMQACVAALMADAAPRQSNGRKELDPIKVAAE